MAVQRSEVEKAYRYFVDAMRAAGDTVGEFELEVWAPGDGATRYRVSRNGRELGDYALGRSEARSRFYAMAAAIDALTRARGERDAMEGN